jgi:hypothetical protein
MKPPTPPPAPHHDAPGWLVPGPLVLRLMLVAALAVALSGTVSAWLVTRASGQEAMRRPPRWSGCCSRACPPCSSSMPCR